MKGHDKIKNLLEFYKNGNIKIHISCNSERFYNGEILKIDLKKELLILIDIKLGETPILFEDIKNIEPFNDLRGGLQNYG